MTELNAPDRDVSRAIRSWLHEDRHEDASRLAGAVLDRVEATTRRRATWWPARRTPVMNKFLGLGLAAAAVVVAAVIGMQLLVPAGSGLGGPGDEPSPGASTDPPSVSSPSPSARATASPSADAGLPQGAHLMLNGRNDAGEDVHPPMTVTIPAGGWEGEEAGGILLKRWDGQQDDGAGMIIFAQEEYLVFGDPCSWATTPATTVTTVDEFVAALAAQPGRDASKPVDISVGGYAGKAITLHISPDVNFSECNGGRFGTWDCGGPDNPEPCGYHAGPGETTTDYILDVDGVLLAWHTGIEADAPPEIAAEVEAIVQSASFGD